MSATPEQIREHCTPRWPMLRMTDEEIAEDGTIPEVSLTDAELVAIKVLIIAAERTMFQADPTPQEAAMQSAWLRAKDKISAALDFFLPKGGVAG